MAFPKESPKIGSESLRRLLSTYSLLAVIVVSAIAGAVLFSPEPQVIGSGNMSVGPNFIFVLGSGYSNVTFAQTFAFTTGTWDSSSVTFDGVKMAVQKTPSASPNALVNISSWNPTTTSAGQVALRWNGTSPSGSNLYVNLTGLPASQKYILYVDAVNRGNLSSDASGFLSVPWSTWSTHAFQLDVVGGGGDGGSGFPISCPPGTIPSGGICVPAPWMPLSAVPWAFLIISSIVFLFILVVLVAPRRRRRQ